MRSLCFVKANAVASMHGESPWGQLFRRRPGDRSAAPEMCRHEVSNDLRFYTDLGNTDFMKCTDVVNRDALKQFVETREADSFHQLDWLCQPCCTQTNR